MKKHQNGPVAKVTFVTFPRSGHHLLERGLRAALGSRFVYQGQVDPRWDYSPGTYWVEAHKTHDYASRYEPKDKELIVVQDRDFEPAYKSWCKYEESRRQPAPPEATWREYFDAFTRRWITGHYLKDGTMYGCPVIRIPYTYLCTDPVEAVQRILRALDAPEKYISKVGIDSWVNTIHWPTEGVQVDAHAELAIREAVEAEEETPISDAMEPTPPSDTPDLPADEAPTEPLGPRQPSCDPSPGESKIRGLGMGTTDEL